MAFNNERAAENRLPLMTLSHRPGQASDVRRDKNTRFHNFLSQWSAEKGQVGVEHPVPFGTLTQSTPDSSTWRQEQ